MAIRPVGKTHALSVSNSSHTAVTVGGDVNDFPCCKAAFLNTGATVVAITVVKVPAGAGSGTVTTAPTSVLPVDATPSDANIVLPASMTQPIVFAVPEMPFSISAIGSAAGPGIVYVTPCEE